MSKYVNVEVSSIDDNLLNQIEQVKVPDFCWFLPNGVDPKCLSPEEYMKLILHINSQNFCFFKQNQNGEITEYKNEGLHGSSAMIYSLINHYMEFSENENSCGVSTQVKPFLLHLTDFITDTFGDINFKNKRKFYLSNVTRKTCSYRNDRCLYADIIDISSGMEMADRIIQIFPGFYDSYKKRAMLTVHMFYGFLKNHYPDHGLITSDRLIKSTTVCPDYRVPQALREYGILRYNDELATKIMKKELIPRDSIMEKSIRSATLDACDVIKQSCNANPVQIDQFFYQKAHNCELPHHYTLTTDY